LPRLPLRLPNGTAACIIEPEPNAWSNSSCRERPANVDTFDYKPELIKRSGEKFEPGGKVELFQSDPGAVMKSPWDWKQFGQCGKWISDLVPNLGSCADDIAFIHSMVSKSNVHGRPRSCRTPALCCPASPAWAPGFPTGWQPDRQFAELCCPARLLVDWLRMARKIGQQVFFPPLIGPR